MMRVMTMITESNTTERITNKRYRKYQTQKHSIIADRQLSITYIMKMI